MKNYILSFTITLLISLFATEQIKAQSVTVNNDFLLQNFIVSLEGGINYGFTDYKTSNFEPGIRGSIEYFPISINNARLGIKVFGGGTRLSYSDSRDLISSNDQPNPRAIPSDIYTDIIQIGSSLNLGFSLSESLIPYVSIGAAYLQFSPKNSNGIIASFNSQGKYDKNIFSVLFEGGAKIKLSDRFGLNAAVSYYPTTSDYLDDISASKGNDSFISGIIGISYAFVGRFDNDDDGIDNHLDLCPDDPEDFDGFEDQDGCPDLDNDKDGILDINDKCPNEAEDLDGFQDEDGCPDLDNDGDGILDISDKCPDQAEDLDGFEDEDGCPDLDNDADGILDINDKCPDEPETKNNFEDEDGCPDSDAQQETFYQFYLRGEDTFNNGSSNIKESAKLVLDEIASYIQNQIGSKWRIEGHMDNQGAVSGIKKLSYNRAKAVYDYLVYQGVAAIQLEVYGLGDSFPIGNNDTPEGRSANKRILIIRQD